MAKCRYCKTDLIEIKNDDCCDARQLARKNQKLLTALIQIREAMQKGMYIKVGKIIREAIEENERLDQS